MRTRPSPTSPGKALDFYAEYESPRVATRGLYFHLRDTLFSVAS